MILSPKRSLIALAAAIFLSCGSQLEDNSQGQAAKPTSGANWGFEYGNCDVSVDCNGKKECMLSCSGNAGCQWKVQPGGFIQCTWIDAIDPTKPRTYIYKKTCAQKIAECIQLDFRPMLSTKPATDG